MFLLTVRLYPCFCLPRVGNRLGRAGGRCLGGSGRKPGTAPSLLASHVARVPVWDGTAVLLTTAVNRLRRQVNRSPLDRLSATPTRYQYQHQDQSESQRPSPSPAQSQYAIRFGDTSLYTIFYYMYTVVYTSSLRLPRVARTRGRSKLRGGRERGGRRTSESMKREAGHRPSRRRRSL